MAVGAGDVPAGRGRVMASDSYNEALRRVLVHEGGFVNDPQDPGGATLHGVTQAVYDAYRRNRGLATRPLSARLENETIWLSERADIYRNQYWNPIQGDRLPPGVDYAVFDGAVNSGVKQSVKWLQRALGVDRVDGIMAEVTLSAARNHPNKAKLVADICAARMAFLRNLRTFARFGRGWTARVNDVQAVAIRMIGAPRVAEAPPADHAPLDLQAFTSSGEKATIDQAAPEPSTAGADATTGAGVATGGLGGVLQQTQETLAPLAGSSDIIGKVVAGLVIAGCLLALGGIIWRVVASIRAAHRAKDLNMTGTA